tara:strand:- start:538 stop:747 length:210 start_codon:yes stop_codon:yes gene_type:complete
MKNRHLLPVFIMTPIVGMMLMFVELHMLMWKAPFIAMWTLNTTVSVVISLCASRIYFKWRDAQLHPNGI